MEKKIKLLPPMMPNFLSVDQLGSLNEFKVRVCELSDKEAVEYGELMKQTFIKHHKEHVIREKKKNNIKNIINNK